MNKNVKLVLSTISLALLLCSCRGGRGGRGSGSVIPSSGTSGASSQTSSQTSGQSGASGQSSTTGTSGESSQSSSGEDSSSTETPPTSLPSVIPTSLPPDVDTYYASITDDLMGDDLLNALNSLNNSKRKKTIGYAGMRYFAAKCDADPDGSGKIIGFYDNAKIGPSWDSGNTWNREHVWPEARGGGSVEADAHMVRPASVSTNTGRGSKGFGTDSFDPGKDIPFYRGVASRIIFYCAIANKSLKLSEDPFNHDYSGSDPANTMGCLGDMLRWNLQYQSADTSFTGANDIARRTEVNRNDVIQNDSDGQGNRNPFIDHPEYACRIWGTKDATTRSICGM